jgi:lysophospholipase L1-like esterase
MKALADARGARLLVIFQPELGNKLTLAPGEVMAWKAFLDWAAPRHVRFDAPRFSVDYRHMIETASRSCDALQIPHLDLNSDPRFRQNPDEFFIDQVHLNAHAHAYIAEILREELKRVDVLG